MGLQDNYFDFWDVFRNHIVGDTNLVIGIVLILIVYFALKNRVPYPALLLVLGLAMSILFEATGLRLLWIGFILMTGFIYYLALNKIFR